MKAMIMVAKFALWFALGAVLIIAGIAVGIASACFAIAQLYRNLFGEDIEWRVLGLLASAGLLITIALIAGPIHWR